MLPLKFARHYIVIFIALCLPAMVCADIALPKIFGDHMVLQRNSTIKVWGSAEPNEKLIVKFIDQVVPVTANAKGEWNTRIKTPKAGGPYKLEVSAEKGDPKIVISDVMIGEVWICSGESNMEWPVAEALNPEEEIKAAKDFPQIRLFKVERHASAQKLKDFAKATPWSCCSSETVKGFSAVGYYYARELATKLKVPVGIIDSSWEDSVCEAWTDRSAMDDVAELGPLLRHWDENDEPTSKDRPSNLFNGMIAPLLGYRIRGIIWYQGESNVGRGHQYATLFPTLIKNWRKDLGNGDEEMPFLYVQLAPFRYKGSVEALPEVRDAQLKALKTTPAVGMVVTTDIGNVKEKIPRNKQEVGRRLARIAFGNTYLKELPEEEQEKAKIISGPIYESLSINKNRARVTFTHTGSGLKATGNENQELTHFMLCGEDKKFHPAKAKIDGDAVVLISEKVTNPIAVRFAWDDSAIPNFYNAEGLPASPFRTDEFDLMSKDRQF